MFTLGVISESAFYKKAQDFNASLLDFILKYQFVRGNWALDIGAKVSLCFNNNNNDFDHYHSFVMPQVTITHSLLTNKLWLYASLDGNNYLNAYSTLLEETEHIFPLTKLMVSSIPISLNVGLKGFIARNLNFDISAGFIEHKGLLSFVTLGSNDNDTENYPIAQSPLQAYYTTHNEKFIHGELNYSSKGIRIGGAFKVSNFTKYKTHYNIGGEVFNVEQEPLGRAKFESNLFAEVNSRERIFFGVSAYYRGKSLMLYDVYSVSPVVVTKIYAKSYLDLGLYAKYVYNNNITFFARIENLLNANIQHYGMYLEKELSGKIGVLIKF